MEEISILTDNIDLGSSLVWVSGGGVFSQLAI